MDRHRHALRCVSRRVDRTRDGALELERRDQTASGAAARVSELPEPSNEPRIARAAVLPDRFVIAGTFGDTVLPDVVGAPIPDDLALAPDPAHAEPLVDRDEDGRLVVAEPLRWMVDFDVAVRSAWASGFRSRRRGTRPGSIS